MAAARTATVIGRAPASAATPTEPHQVAPSAGQRGSEAATATQCTAQHAELTTTTAVAAPTHWQLTLGDALSVNPATVWETPSELHCSASSSTSTSDASIRRSSPGSASARMVAAAASVTTATGPRLAARRSGAEITIEHTPAPTAITKKNTGTLRRRAIRPLPTTATAQRSRHREAASGRTAAGPPGAAVMCSSPSRPAQAHYRSWPIQQNVTGASQIWNRRAGPVTSRVRESNEREL